MNCPGCPEKECRRDCAECKHYMECGSCGKKLCCGFHLKGTVEGHYTGKKIQCVSCHNGGCNGTTNYRACAALGGMNDIVMVV